MLPKFDPNLSLRLVLGVWFSKIFGTDLGNEIHLPISLPYPFLLFRVWSNSPTLESRSTTKDLISFGCSSDLVCPLINEEKEEESESETRGVGEEEKKKDMKIGKGRKGIKVMVIL